MTDDIVTRLRHEVARCWCAEKSQNEPVGKPFFRCESCDNQLRAADEIERLRQIVKDAWKLVDLTQECQDPHNCELCQGKAKAVRGD